MPHHPKPLHVALKEFLCLFFYVTFLPKFPLSPPFIVFGCLIILEYLTYFKTLPSIYSPLYRLIVASKPLYINIPSSSKEFGSHG